MTGFTDLRHVALAAWLLPWLASIGAYLLSADAGFVDWCIPPLAGCDSISASGRHGWGYFLFKALMLPAAGIIAVYWLMCASWLEHLGASRNPIRGMLGLGLIAAAFLALYATFLGSDGDVYRTLRRYGTVVFFSFSFLAQIVMTRALGALRDGDVPASLLRWKVRMLATMLIGGLAFTAAGYVAEVIDIDNDAIENRAEWIMAALLTVFPVLTWAMWRRTGRSLRWG